MIEMEEVIGIANSGSHDHLGEGGAGSSPSPRNIVFWRFKSEFREEKQAAFSCSLGPGARPPCVLAPSCRKER